MQWSIFLTYGWPLLLASQGVNSVSLCNSPSLFLTRFSTQRPRGFALRPFSPSNTPILRFPTPSQTPLFATIGLRFVRSLWLAQLSSAAASSSSQRKGSKPSESHDEKLDAGQGIDQELKSMAGDASKSIIRPGRPCPGYLSDVSRWTRRIGDSSIPRSAWLPFLGVKQLPSASPNLCASHSRHHVSFHEPSRRRAWSNWNRVRERIDLEDHPHRSASRGNLPSSISSLEWSVGCSRRGISVVRRLLRWTLNDEERGEEGPRRSSCYTSFFRGWILIVRRRRREDEWCRIVRRVWNSQRLRGSEKKSGGFSRVTREKFRFAKSKPAAWRMVSERQTFIRRHFRGTSPDCFPDKKKIDPSSSYDFSTATQTFPHSAAEAFALATLHSLPHALSSCRSSHLFSF